jgi:hypothetical protein
MALQALGGAKAIIATFTSADAMEAVAGVLGRNGTLMIIGAAVARRPSDGPLAAGILGLT